MRPRSNPARLVLLTAAALLLAACSTAATVAPGYATRDSSSDTLAPVTGGAANGTSKEGTPQVTTSDTLVDGSQVIRTGSLLLQVADVAAAVDGGKAAITALGGYVASSRQSAGDNQPVAVITYRVPAEKWDDGLAALRRLATKVVDETTDSQDVTAQLVDIDARLKNLRASETALQEIAAKATRVSDVLEVQAQLTSVRGQIESLAAQQKALQGRVAFATVTVTYGLQLGAISAASKQYFMAQTVDWAYDIDAFRPHLDKLSRYDVLQGVRPRQFSWSTLSHRSDSLYKGVVSLTNYLLIRVLFQPATQCPSTGYKLIPS